MADLICIDRKGENSMTQKEIDIVVRLTKLNSRLVEALEKAGDFIKDGSYHNWQGLEEIDALLKEARGVK